MSPEGGGNQNAIQLSSIRRMSFHVLYSCIFLLFGRAKRWWPSRHNDRRESCFSHSSDKKEVFKMVFCARCASANMPLKVRSLTQSNSTYCHHCWRTHTLIYTMKKQIVLHRAAIVASCKSILQIVAVILCRSENIPLTGVKVILERAFLLHTLNEDGWSVFAR